MENVRILLYNTFVLVFTIFLAAINVFRINIATVIGPTPPLTRVTYMSEKVILN